MPGPQSDGIQGSKVVSHMSYICVPSCYRISFQWLSSPTRI